MPLLREAHAAAHPLPIPPAPTPTPCSAPEVSAQGLLPTTGVAEVTPPGVGGPWDSYELVVCPLGTGPARRLLAEGGCTTVSCSPVAATGRTSCPLKGLTPDTR